MLPLLHLAQQYDVRPSTRSFAKTLELGSQLRQLTLHCLHVSILPDGQPSARQHTRGTNSNPSKRSLWSLTQVCSLGNIESLGTQDKVGLVRIPLKRGLYAFA